MKRTPLRFIALALAMALLLTGCALDYAGYFSKLAQSFRPVTFDNMTYTRPDPALLDDALAKCLESAQGNNLDRLIGHINSMNSISNSFQTSYYLAYIRYSIDMTDSYWAQEYNYCSQLSTRVQAAVDELMYALADSPLREKLESEEYFGPGYFDDYDGDSLWTEEFKALMAQETELVNQYYELSSLSTTLDPSSEAYLSTIGTQMAQVYVDLVTVRKDIASEAGYNSYAEFAYDFIYQRSYSPEQTRSYLTDIRTQLVDCYTDLAGSDLFTDAITYSTEDMTFEYVKTMARSMGGIVEEAFSVMEKGGLYHISYGPNKLGASFEVFLPEYQVPFIFMNPTLTSQDQLTFAHEFGHFCNDFASGGPAAGVDVAEFFSQGMEYLSLFYADGGQNLEKLKLADSLCVFIEQACLADFEDRVYAMKDQDLTVESIRQLYAQVTGEYGFGDLVDPRSYVTITHLFTSPLYVISYVVSNDVAMQLYRMEKSKAGAGLKCYTDNLATQTADLLTFAQEAGLESPFTHGHIGAMKKIFDEIV